MGLLQQCIVGLVILGTGLCYCPDGWLSHNGKCYIFSHSSVSWVDALNLCKRLGGQLAEIDTPIEGVYLENTAKLLNASFYIGAHDLLVPGRWEWITSKSSVNDTGYTNWAPGCPSKMADHDCVYLNHQNGQWVNGRCNDDQYFVCESKQN